MIVEQAFLVEDVGQFLSQVLKKAGCIENILETNFFLFLLRIL